MSTREQWQLAGQTAERAMLNFLMQYEPAGDLTISDAKLIAAQARQLVFAALEYESEDEQ